MELQDANDSMKLVRGCDDCAWRQWARGLDWDHVRGNKKMSISSLIANGRPLMEIFMEMEKCDVVCANCHRIRTATRRIKPLQEGPHTLPSPELVVNRVPESGE